MIRLRSILPRGLYGRAALILIVPIVTIQLVVSMAFIQRHFDGVTQQLTGAVVLDLGLVMGVIRQAGSVDEARTRLAPIADALAMELDLPATSAAPTADLAGLFDLSGEVILRTLRERLPGFVAAQVRTEDGFVRMQIATPLGPLGVGVKRARFAASNPHQLLVLMIGTSILLTVIAYAFLRNQLRPITQLARAAEAFGKGRAVPYRPRGALEVRAAGAAFLDMRARIERQIEQRTLLLSGVSHDLRTPMTRMRLSLSMFPDEEETRALLADLSDMERLVDEFLAFARGDAMEEAQKTDVADVVRRAVDMAARAGKPVTMDKAQGLGDLLMRPLAVQRALENLINNADRFGSRVAVSVRAEARSVTLVVEDDGPGIPKDRRDEALRPFTRLDAARDPNRGGGVGLGLSIAMDIARSHGGTLRLGDSARLGGLKAELVLAR